MVGRSVCHSFWIRVLADLVLCIRLEDVIPLVSVAEEDTCGCLKDMISNKYGSFNN